MTYLRAESWVRDFCVTKSFSLLILENWHTEVHVGTLILTVTEQRGRVASVTLCNYRPSLSCYSTWRDDYGAPDRSKSRVLATVRGRAEHPEARVASRGQVVHWAPINAVWRGPSCGIISTANWIFAGSDSSHECMPLYCKGRYILMHRLKC